MTQVSMPAPGTDSRVVRSAQRAAMPKAPLTARWGPTADRAGGRGPTTSGLEATSGGSPAGGRLGGRGQGPAMSHQVPRHGRFAASPSPGELGQFFRLDAKGLEAARSERAPANRLGWAVQWGCVRMLGVFPAEDLSMVPEAVVRFAAEQLDVGPGQCCRPNRGRICSRCPGCGRADRTAAHPREEAGRALSPAELGESAGGSLTTAVPVRSSGVVSPAPRRPHDGTTSRSGGARVSGPR
ncbi:DUF4158 domain-containing protein [Streptomyces sp. LN699]|uniref:DUF4158 domain-containing protein n=1 Tax=Streptomyces sp. LN699 TaxID=3112981 RepID=UPI00372035BC